MSRSEFNTRLEEARANTHPVHVRCTGNQQQDPIQNAHDEAILEGFTHCVLIRTIEHCIRFGVKGQRPAAVDAQCDRHSQSQDIDLQSLCDTDHNRHVNDRTHVLTLEDKVARDKDSRQHSIEREVGHRFHAEGFH